MVGFFHAIGSYFRAIGFLSKNKLWSFAIIPGLVSVGVGVLVFIVLGSFADNLVDGFFSWLCDVYPPSWWLHDGICGVTEWLAGSWLGEIISWVLSLMLNLFIFRYIVMIVVPVFMGTLSEKVEENLSGKKVLGMNTVETLNSTLRGIRMALRNILREIIYVALISVGGLLLPGLGTLVSTGLAFVIQAFYAGFGNVDPVLDRRGKGVKDSVAYARGHRLWLTGNGTPFLLLILIPFLGWFLGPVLATVAGTMTYMKLEKREGA